MLLAERLLNPLGMTHSGAAGLGAGTFLPGHFGDREVGHRDHPVPGPGGVSVTIVDLARYAQACLAPAADTARRRRHHGIGTEHLLLALFQDAESPAASTLAAFGMTHEDTTAKILQAWTAAAEASRRETSQ